MTVAPDPVRVAQDPLRDELRVLDVVRLDLDHVGDQHRALRQPDLLEDRPLVRVTRIGGLELYRVGPGLPDHVDDLLERHVAVVRARVVAPAQVHAHLLGRDVDERAVQCRSLEPGGVRFRRLHVPDADRRVAGRGLAVLAPRVSRHAGLGARKVLEVLEDVARARAAEAVQPVLDVGGVAQLRPLAVVDDVDAGWTWRATASSTPRSIRSSSAALSIGMPSSRANMISTRSSGRGRLPTCVVRMRPFVVSSGPRGYLGVPGRGGPAGCRNTLQVAVCGS